MSESAGGAGYGPFDIPVKLGPTEYGGKEGLVQLVEDGHQPTAAEKLGMANRTSGSDPLGVDPVTGLPVPLAD